MPATALQVPSEIVTKWQEIVDLLAEIIRVPAALVMKVEPPNVKVLVSSKSAGNPYEQGELASLNTGLYCESVMKTRQPLFVPDALADEKWNSNPDIKLGMTSYLGFPITWPNGDIFGTICVLDNKRNDYNDLYRKLLLHCRDVLETHLRTAANLGERLRLLLNLTSRITSSLDLREVLRSIAANIREVMHADAVVVALPDEASGKFKAFGVDFPHGKGVLKEELLVTPSPAHRRAMDTLKPVFVDARERNELSPEVHDIAAAEGFKAACAIPLVNRARAVGILSILRTTETLFTPEDVDFLSAASGQIAIAIENALAFREISELKDKLAQEKLYLEEEIRGDIDFEQIVGNSLALKRVLELVGTVAPNDSTVLLLGETGTGKELIARAIHDRSRRKDRTFVKLNCAAIPTGLLESELFGHEKGAFTGAITQKMGRLELADQGTLFLDEVGDIPIEIQPKLLRALQEREFERLGSTHTRKVNVRLVAATRRTFTLRVCVLPSRSNSCSCSTRSSFGWISIGMSPTSSRNSVPWSANSSRPIFWVMAPVKAPFS